MNRPPRTLLFTLLLAILGGSPSGCGNAQNFLQGSIGERFDLDFDFVKVARKPESIIVSYLKQIAYPEISYQGDNTVLELKVDLIPDASLVGGWLDVTGAVVLNRYILFMQQPYELAQDERRFPTVYLAKITFFELGAVAGERLAGQFNMVFEDGSTLRGGFSAEL